MSCHINFSNLHPTPLPRRAKKSVAKLLRVYTKFVAKVEGRRNYSNKWVVAADSVRSEINRKICCVLPQHPYNYW